MNEIKKAIEILNDPESDMEYSGEEIRQAHLLVMSLLEKRIPKKIEIKDFKLCKDFHCPICSFRFVTKIDKELVGGMIKNYCPDCGQKIDWGNEDE